MCAMLPVRAMGRGIGKIRKSIRRLFVAHQKALQLIELGFHPVLLGRSGDGLKRPLYKGWQTAVYTSKQLSRWPEGHNVGIRCGKQRTSLSRASRGSRFLLVFDFDEDAERVFPAWQVEATKIVEHDLLIVTSGRGYHAYFYVPDEMGSRTLAGRRIVENGRPRLQKIIETIGRRKQVVSAGSRHPNGGNYCFYGTADYEDSPTVGMKQLSDLTRLARCLDERPATVQSAAPRKTIRKQRPVNIQNCLDYARRFIGSNERVEPNGDIRFLGHGGLLVTADGRGWYAFSEETGGGLSELVAWHQVIVGEGHLLIGEDASSRELSV